MKERTGQDNCKGGSRGRCLLGWLCGPRSGERPPGWNIHWDSLHERCGLGRAVTEVGSECTEAVRTLRITTWY